MNSHPSPNFSRLAVTLITACVLASCATYSKVSERRPRFMPFTSGAGSLANAETGIVKAMRIDRREPLVALGEYLRAAETALGQLNRAPTMRLHAKRTTLPSGASSRRSATRSSILGRNRSECRVAMASSCLRTSPTRAHSGIQRSTILRQRINSTSVGLTSPNAPRVMESVRRSSRLDAK